MLQFESFAGEEKCLKFQHHFERSKMNERLLKNWCPGMSGTVATPPLNEPKDYSTGMCVKDEVKKIKKIKK